MSEFLTTKQVAEKLNIAISTVTFYIRTGQLKAIKLGKGYRVTEENLENFIKERSK